MLAEGCGLLLVRPDCTRVCMVVQRAACTLLELGFLDAHGEVK